MNREQDTFDESTQTSNQSEQTPENRRETSRWCLASSLVLVLGILGFVIFIVKQPWPNAGQKNDFATGKVGINGLGTVVILVDQPKNGESPDARATPEFYAILQESLSKRMKTNVKVIVRRLEPKKFEVIEDASNAIMDFETLTDEPLPPKHGPGELDPDARRKSYARTYDLRCCNCKTQTACEDRFCSRCGTEFATLFVEVIPNDSP